MHLRVLILAFSGLLGGLALVRSVQALDFQGVVSWWPFDDAFNFPTSGNTRVGLRGWLIVCVRRRLCRQQLRQLHDYAEFVYHWNDWRWMCQVSWCAR